LLAFIRLLIRRYRESPELGWADFTVLEQPHRNVLAHQCTWDDRRIVALHNFSEEPCTVALRLDGCTTGDRLLDLLTDDGGCDLAEDGTCELTLDGYGFRWLRLMSRDSRRLA
jgi:hypothetical protein